MTSRYPASPEELVRIADVRRMCVSGEAKRIREAARVSLREMGSAIGVDHKAVAQWETGSARPDAGNALAFAGALSALARFADPTRTRSPNV